MESIVLEVKGIIYFPCHSKEKVLVYEDTTGCCSAKCPFCSQFAIFDLDRMSARSVPPAKGVIGQLRQRQASVKH